MSLFPPSVVNRFLTLIFRYSIPSISITITRSGPFSKPAIALDEKSNGLPALSLTISLKIRLAVLSQF